MTENPVCQVLSENQVYPAGLERLVHPGYLVCLVSGESLVPQECRCRQNRVCLAPRVLTEGLVPKVRRELLVVQGLRVPRVPLGDLPRVVVSVASFYLKGQGISSSWVERKGSLECQDFVERREKVASRACLVCQETWVAPVPRAFLVPLENLV